MEQKKWVAYVSGSDRARNFLYNNHRAEMLCDIMWAFMYGNATSVTVAPTKARKNQKTFSSLQECRTEWQKLFGDANYMIWRDRIKTING